MSSVPFLTGFSPEPWDADITPRPRGMRAREGGGSLGVTVRRPLSRQTELNAGAGPLPGPSGEGQHPLGPVQRGILGRQASDLIKHTGLFLDKSPIKVPGQPQRKGTALEVTGKILFLK